MKFPQALLEGYQDFMVIYFHIMLSKMIIHLLKCSILFKKKNYFNETCCDFLNNLTLRSLDKAELMVLFSILEALSICDRLDISLFHFGVNWDNLVKSEFSAKSLEHNELNDYWLHFSWNLNLTTLSQFKLSQCVISVMLL